MSSKLGGSSGHLLWLFSPWKTLQAVSGKGTEPGPGWCGVHAVQSPVGQASGPITQALRWGGEAASGVPRGWFRGWAVWREVGASSRCLVVQVVDRQAERPGARVRAGGLCRGPPWLRGWHGWGPRFLPVCPAQEDAALQGPGCAFRSSCVGDRARGGLGGLDVSRGRSSAPPPLAVVSRDRWHFLQGSAIA